MTDTSNVFVVDGATFFAPHPGAQTEIVTALARRVVLGEGPSKWFLRGNRGSGKSYLIRRGVLHALAMGCPGLRYVVVRRNLPDLRLNHLIYLNREMAALGGTFHDSQGICKYDNGSMGFYRQCEDERDVEKIVGAEAAVIFVDEAPQIKWEFLRTMAPSLRVSKSPDGSQPYWVAEIYGGNPIGESIEELDRFFVDQDVDTELEPEYDPLDWKHIPLFRKDNPSLDEREYLKQFAGVPPQFRAAWVDGVRMDSRTMFDVYPRKDGKPYHHITELPRIDGVPLLRVPWIQVYRSFDMGYFPDPAFCVWFVVLGHRVIAVHEEAWFRTIARDLAVKMIETTTELVGETPVVMTYADPQIDLRTGSDTVTVRDTLEMAGVPIECSINDRVLYADAIHGLLGEEVEPGVPRLQIYTPGCPMLAKVLPKIRWDDKNPRRMANHKFDHPVVDLAYFAISSGVLSTTAAPAAETVRPDWMNWVDEAVTRVPRRRSY